MAESTDQRIQKLLQNKAKEQEADELEKSSQMNGAMSEERPQNMSGRNGPQTLTSSPKS
jgi:hypothetical protein